MGNAVRLWPLVAIAFLAAASSSAQEVPIPEGVFRYAPASTVFGPDATWINPAVLGRFKPSAAELMADYRDDSFAKSWGGVITGQGLGVAYRRIHVPNDKDFREYVFAGAIPLGQMLAIGGSYRHFASGPAPYDERHYWNIAVISRGQSPFAVAAVLSNLNRSAVAGESSDIQQRYSVAYRPQGKILTFAVDALSSTERDPDDWTFVYHAELAPTPGLYIEGFIDSESNFEVGVRANLLRYFVGSQSHFDSDANHQFTHLYIGATDNRQPSLMKEKNRRLSLSIGGTPSENPIQPVFGNKRIPFGDMILGIYRAGEDETIEEMVLHIDHLRLSFAQAQELREAMQWFRSQNKRIICHITGPNNIGYYIAVAADSILLPPVSELNLIGLRAELTFYAGTMEKLGIAADMVRIGEYKTAPEAFTRESSSDENRERTNRILDDLYAQFVAGIADGRGMTPDKVRNLIDRGPFTSKDALDLGLIDGLSYRDRIVEDSFLTRMPEITYRQYRADTLLNDGWPRIPEIAVVFAEGEITDGRVDPDPFENAARITPGVMDRAFRKAQSERSVRAIVFRVNSPGGFALAGEDIYHTTERVSKKKLIVVSMGSVAASGGYYISMAARRIFASPGTITGSIGIYGGKPVLADLYEKIDLGKELYVRGAHAGMLTWTRPFTDEERQIYFDHLKAFYEHFVTLVAKNRTLPADSIDALGRGRVWTGREALSNGLVDELGGLKQAVEYTAEQSKLEDYRLVAFPKRRMLFQLPSVPFLGMVGRLLGLSDESLESAAGALSRLPDGDIFARLPYDIDIQ